MKWSCRHTIFFKKSEQCVFFTWSTKRTLPICTFLLHESEAHDTNEKQTNDRNIIKSREANSEHIALHIYYKKSTKNTYWSNSGCKARIPKEVNWSWIEMSNKKTMEYDIYAWKISRFFILIEKLVVIHHEKYST